LKDVLYFSKTIQKDTFFTAQIAQVHIESNGEFQLIPTLGDHTVIIGSVENLEDKLNRLYTFYKKVWVHSGVNAYQVIDCRFDQQIVALKKGMQAIQYAPGTVPFVRLKSLVDSASKVDTTRANAKLPSSAAISKPETKVLKDTVKAKPVLTKTIQMKPSGLTSLKPPVQKLAKTKKILSINNNKQNNKTLNNKKKTAKAIMPSKTTSNNNNN
jgi:cell division protein FtsQ